MSNCREHWYGQSLRESGWTHSSRNVDALLDKLYWATAQGLKHSVPSRIAKAEPYIRPILREYANINGTEMKDVVSMLYLAMSLSKSSAPDEQNEALSLFEEAFQYCPTPEPFGVQKLGPKNFLWAKAGYACLLRAKGRQNDAQVQEKYIREWILNHPLALPPSEMRVLTNDDTSTSSNNPIMDHASIRKLYGNAVELPDGPGGTHMMMFDF